MEKENTYLRLGVYGGTFSPPHLGHVHAAESFLSFGGIDRLLIVPTHQTPMKAREEDTAPADRLAMCRLAFSFSSRVSVSDIEIRRGGKSYTAETLRALSSPSVSLSFLCGTDMFLSMGNWYSPETVFALAEIVCMRREGHEEKADRILTRAQEYRRDYGARIRFLDVSPIVLSSSDVRRHAAAGDALCRYLTPSVYDYIKEKGLYGCKK